MLAVLAVERIFWKAILHEYIVKEITKSYCENDTPSAESTNLDNYERTIRRNSKRNKTYQ